MIQGLIDGISAIAGNLVNTGVSQTKRLLQKELSKQAEANQVELQKTWEKNHPYVAHDFFYVANSMYLQLPLEKLTDYRALEMMCETFQSPQVFVLGWYKQKDAGRVKPELLNTELKRINKHIRMTMPEQLAPYCGSLPVQMVFPALSRGMTVIQIEDARNIIYFHVHVNC